MAKISLQNPAKTLMYSKMRTVLTYAGLSKTAGSTTETHQAVSAFNTYLTGGKDILELKKSASGFSINNSISNGGLLLFTVASAEKPLEYFLFNKDGSTYRTDMIITTTKTAPAFDTAVQLQSLSITIKGDGEA